MICFYLTSSFNQVLATIHPDDIEFVVKAEAFGFSLKNAVMASDAFFPFPDCVELAADAGIIAVLQPGGSIKDQDSIDMANQKGIAMVTTGVRHFKH